jgi:hypothetical protein
MTLQRPLPSRETSVRIGRHSRREEEIPRALQTQTASGLVPLTVLKSRIGTATRAHQAFE